MIQVNFVKLRSGAREPVYATDGSAAADLFACLDDSTDINGLAVENCTVTIPAGGRVSIPIGIAIEPVIEHQFFGPPHGDGHGGFRPPEDMPRAESKPHGDIPQHYNTFPDSYVALVFGRSGHGAKFGVTLANSVGVIDSDYRGEIKVTLINHGDKPFTVMHGDRVAQLAFVPVATAHFTLAQTLGETQRGEGGFGSTGR